MELKRLEIIELQTQTNALFSALFSILSSFYFNFLIISLILNLYWFSIFL